jgi:hypothetical protein
MSVTVRKEWKDRIIEEVKASGHVVDGVKITAERISLTLDGFSVHLEITILSKTGPLFSFSELYSLSAGETIQLEGLSEPYFDLMV